MDEQQSVYDEIAYLNDQLTSSLNEIKGLQNDLSQVRLLRERYSDLKKEAESYRLELEDANAQIHSLENELKRKNAPLEDIRGVLFFVLRLCLMIISAFCIYILGTSFWPSVFVAVSSFFIGAILLLFLVAPFIFYKFYFAPEISLSEKLPPVLYWIGVLLTHVLGSMLMLWLFNHFFQ